MYYTYRQARELLGLSRKKMARMVERGLIPGAFERDDGKLRFDQDQLLVFASTKSFERLQRDLGIVYFPIDEEFIVHDGDGVSERAPKKVVIKRSEEDCPKRVAFLAGLAEKKHE